MTKEDFFNQFDIDIAEGRLGGGAFGTVYKSYDSINSLWKAIKIAEVKYIGGKSFSLISEFNATKDLKPHKNIANYESVHQFKMPNGVFDYAVMQYYEEGNLKDLLKKGKLDFSQKTEIANGIISGIHYLHQHSVIHRDLKPSNILISKRRNEYIPKIADFGLSKLVSEAGVSEITNSFGGGTLEYSSPEQLAGQALKYNSDLWSVGVLIFELFAGKIPFDSDSFVGSDAARRAQIYQNINEVKIQGDIVNLPSPYNEIIARTLVRDPSKRVQESEEIVQLLKTQISKVASPAIITTAPKNKASTISEETIIIDQEEIEQKIKEEQRKAKIEEERLRQEHEKRKLKEELEANKEKLRLQKERELALARQKEEEKRLKKEEQQRKQELESKRLAEVKEKLRIQKQKELALVRQKEEKERQKKKEEKHRQELAAKKLAEEKEKRRVAKEKELALLKKKEKEEKQRIKNERALSLKKEKEEHEIALNKQKAEEKERKRILLHEQKKKQKELKLKAQKLKAEKEAEAFKQKAGLKLKRKAERKEKWKERKPAFIKNSKRSVVALLFFIPLVVGGRVLGKYYKSIPRPYALGELQGFKNGNGKVIIEAEYDQVFPFKNGEGIAIKGDSTFVFDKKGELIQSGKNESEEKSKRTDLTTNSDDTMQSEEIVIEKNEETNMLGALDEPSQSGELEKPNEPVPTEQPTKIAEESKVLSKEKMDEKLQESDATLKKSVDLSDNSLPDSKPLVLEESIAPSLPNPQDKVEVETSDVVVEPPSLVSAYLSALEAKMIRIKGGSFKMGCEGKNQDCQKDEGPSFSAKLGNFYMAKYEVTQKEFTEIMAYNPSYKKSCPSCPVENVSYNEVLEYIAKLNEVEGNRFRYRLPTEKEWEYAALGGESYVYAGSNDPEAVAQYKSNNGVAAIEVGKTKINGYGLYGMSGNVAEWCGDWYSKNTYATDKLPQSGTLRVVRGGSWNDRKRIVRVKNRGREYPDTKKPTIGFRLLREEI